MTKLVVRRAWIFGLLSFVPVAGIVLAILGMFWGFLAATRKRAVTAGVVLIMSSVIGLVVQPFLAYWAYGYVMDNKCLSDTEAMATSIQAYRASHNDYPASLADLAGWASARCRGGGGEYIYFHPSAATGPATQPADRPDLQLLVAEMQPAHRHLRMCVTADMKARALPHDQFRAMLAMPYNHQFAAAMAPPPPKKTDFVLAEDPDFRFVGLNAKQLLGVCVGGIILLCIVGTFFVVRGVRKALREGDK